MSSILDSSILPQSFSPSRRRLRAVFAFGFAWLSIPPAPADLIRVEAGAPFAASAGVRLVADYGAFQVLEVVSGTGKAAAASLGGVLLPSPETIVLDSGEIPTGGGAEKALRGFEIPSGEEGAVLLVQFEGPAKSEWLDALRASGALLVAPVPPYAWLIWSDPAALAALSGVPGLRWAGPLSHELKAHPGVKARAAAAPPGKAAAPEGVIVQIATGAPGAAEGTAIEIEALGGSRISLRDYGTYANWRGEIPPAALPAAASLARVLWIEPLPHYRLSGERAAQISAGIYTFPQNSALPFCTTPGYGQFLNLTGRRGEGQIVHVVDSGLDQGVSTNQEGTAHPDLVGRIAGILNPTRDSLGSDLDGHGTINAGIIMGNAFLNMRDKDGFLLGQGLAPAARVFATKIFRSSGQFDIGSLTFADLAAGGLAGGAYASNNSWGSDTFGDYTADCQEYDLIVRDGDAAAPGNQPYAAVFSAGNAGTLTPTGEQTLGSPASAKNVVAVGASENCDADGSDRSNVGPPGSNNISDMAGFSSRGPAKDGRYGVTIVAPGTHVQGPASTARGYLGSGVSNAYWPEDQTAYARSSGTSHAAPQGAAAAALFAQDHLARTGFLPSPALIKAALAGSAVSLAGGDNGKGRQNDPPPNPHSGWGRMHLGNLLTPGEGPFLRDERENRLFVSAGEEETIVVNTIDTGLPLRIMLVWTDAPAAPLAGTALVNDLDLEVSREGERYTGNAFSGGASIPGGGEPDVHNNIEGIFIDRPAGSYFIKISARNLAGDGVPGNEFPADQDYALAVFNGSPQSGEGSVTTDAKTYACGGSASIQVSDADLKSAPSARVEASCGGDSESLTLVPFSGASGVFKGTLPLSGGTPVPGDGALQIADGLSLSFAYRDESHGAAGPKTIQTSALADCAPPGITDVSIRDIGFDRFTVDFRTSEPATPKALAGLDCARYDISAEGAGFALSHTITLRNLKSCSLYLLELRASDAAGNLGSDKGAGGFCIPVATRKAVTGFLETADPAPLPGWRSSANSGPGVWRAENSSFAASAPKCWRTAGAGSISDFSLVSPPLDLPPGSILSFRHTFSFEEGFDGGMIEASADGGATWIDLGPAVIEGGYTHKLSSQFENPLAGRNAWSGGQLGAMSEVKVDLSAFAGTKRRFRFRAGYDNSVTLAGWQIDEIRITSGATCENSALPESWNQYP